MDKNILVILPDGVGLKNFGFSNFVSLLDERKINVTFWNSTPFDLEKLNFNSINLSKEIPPKTDLLKRAKIDIELDCFSNKFNDDVYASYKFPSVPRGIKSQIKNKLFNYYKIKYKGKVNRIQDAIDSSIIKSDAYSTALKILQKEKPDLVFCTNQRASNAIAPILAAQSLNIPTACFIFSWDNLPKATKIIDTNFYFVWSDFMKKELVKYYPEIDVEQIKVVGTPQFEPHFQLQERDVEKFYTKYQICHETTYILFSGDDITTSPKDEEYLEAVCEAVTKLNVNSKLKLNVLFRPCPVDFSNRYDEVLNKYQSIITEIQPYWEKQGDSWNTISPTKEDAILLANTINVSSLVINLGSSMVFDAVCHNKPTAYMNFNPRGIDVKRWSVEKIYNFIHFQSMPNKDAVIWLNNKEEIADKILEGLNNSEKYVTNAKKWFEVINQQPADKASERIVIAINQILSDGVF
ncbi:MAG: UDP-glycosyltransferase [Flavobacteriaceae bacterium]|nr:UDP-glycosyltransferase [Flavobacteriaceae bacterium]